MDEGDRQVPQTICGVLAAVADAAAIKRVDAGQSLDQRGLSRAVLAKQRDDLAAADTQTNIIERAGGAELLRGAPHLQQRRSGRNACYCSGLSLASGCHAFASAALFRAAPHREHQQVCLRKHT